MAIQQGMDWRYLWSTAWVDMFPYANLCWNEFMFQNLFEDIICYIAYTFKEAPNYRGSFFSIQDLIDA
jgi:hypothetical protein